MLYYDSRVLLASFYDTVPDLLLGYHHSNVGHFTSLHYTLNHSLFVELHKCQVRNVIIMREVPTEFSLC